MEVKDMKIEFIPMDHTACGMYRVRNPQEVMYDKCKCFLSSPGVFFPHGQNWIYTQRLCHPNSMKQIIEMKKKVGCKIAIDFDDDVWHPLPEYNKCAVHWKENYEAMKLYLSELADVVTCTNEHLKNNISEFIDKDRIVIIPNALNYNRWRFDPTKSPDEISFFYAGSPTHYDNVNRLYGDFSKGVADYLNRHKVIIQGIKPWFLPNAQVLSGWVPILDYPTWFARNALQAKFVLSPLADNEWNENKSDLKYLECAAVGRVCLCSDISTYECAHPYQRIPKNCTSQTFQFIVHRAIENYDMLLKHQYNVLNSRWLKADQYLDLFAKY